jgi:hypothetical protein
MTRADMEAATPKCTVQSHRPRPGRMQTTLCGQPLRPDFRSDVWCCPAHPHMRMSFERVGARYLRAAETLAIAA